MVEVLFVKAVLFFVVSWSCTVVSQVILGLLLTICWFVSNIISFYLL